MSIAAAFAADKEPAFRPGPAASFANKLTDAKITIAADPYTTPEKLKPAFGKLDPNEHGVLPVLVVIQNDSDKAIKLDRLRVSYNTGSQRAEAIPPKEVRYVKGPDRPKMTPGPLDRVKINRSKKNPLDAWEIEGRAFSAQILTPGNSAYGFFYFQAPLQKDATIYLNGMTDAATGNPLIYFEIPLR